MPPANSTFIMPLPLRTPNPFRNPPLLRHFHPKLASFLRISKSPEMTLHFHCSQMHRGTSAPAKIEVPPQNKNHEICVIVFPGSNCDHDAFFAVSNNLGQQAEYIWHDSTSLGDVDAV